MFTISRRKVVRAIAGALVATAVAAGTSACVGRAGAAATINGKAVTDQQINDATTQLNKIIAAQSTSSTSGQVTTIPASTVMMFYVLGVVGNQTMIKLVGQNPTNTEICKELTPKGKAVSLSAPSCSPVLLTTMKANILYSTIQQAAQGGQVPQTTLDAFTKEITADATKANVQLSARYGVFNASVFAKTGSFISTTTFPWSKPLTQPTTQTAATS